MKYFIVLTFNIVFENASSESVDFDRKIEVVIELGEHDMNVDTIKGKSYMFILPHVVRKHKNRKVKDIAIKDILLIHPVNHIPVFPADFYR